MKITTISASVRYSKALGDGSHKTVELSAEATVNGEDWHTAQAALYTELGQQLKALWSANGNGSQQATGTAPQQTAHYCQQHQTEYKRYEKEGRLWYAHKDGQKWCRERA
jgi:hypothetical protein